PLGVQVVRLFVSLVRVRGKAPL
ncbi:hypothetical protein A2U01_0096220, partial [Trifolium medium]|nr:hypothetical protein [Trifolium medium]